MQTSNYRMLHFTGSLWNVHTLVLTISVFLLLPLGIRLIRRKSVWHKPWQFCVILLITIAVILGHVAHRATHKAMHEVYHLHSFHSIFGWLLVAIIWCQVGFGWISSQWNQYICLNRREGCRHIHHFFEILLFPFLWIQWLSGIYALFDITNSAFAPQMWSYTTMGVFLLFMGIYYLTTRMKATALVEAVCMLIGGLLFMSIELLTMDSPRDFLHNDKFLLAVWWFTCGFLGVVLKNAHNVHVDNREVQTKVTEDIPPELNLGFSKPQFTYEQEELLFQISCIPIFLGVVGYAVFVFLHEQPALPSSPFTLLLQKVHILFLTLALVFRGFDMRRLTGSCVIIAAITLVCSQPGLCLVAIELQFTPLVWIIYSLLCGLWIIILVHSYIYWMIQT